MAPTPARNHSLGKALRILQLVAVSPGLGLTEISRAVEMPKATAHRFVTTLAESGFLRADPNTATYTLGHALIALGEHAKEQNPLRAAALVHMHALVAEFNETVHLARRIDGSVVYLEKVESSQSLRHWTNLGQPEPLHSGAASKLLAAYMDEDELRSVLGDGPLKRYTERTITDVDALIVQLREIRAQGYVFSTGEKYADVTSVAVPIRQSTGEVTAALSVGGPTTRFPPEVCDRVLPAALAAARAISDELGANAFVLHPPQKGQQ